MAISTFSKNLPTFVRRPDIAPQLVGSEGQVLNQKITEISRSIQQTESVKRLIQDLEEASKKCQDELRCYLDSLRSEAKLTDEVEFTVFVTDYSWQVWQALSDLLSERGSCLEVPDACPGRSDNFMYTWSRAEHYLECEIFGDGAIEFFYRNRKTGEVWGEDTTLEHGFSTTIFEKAALFAW